MADGTLTADETLSFLCNLIRPDGGFSTVFRLLVVPLVNAWFHCRRQKGLSFWLNGELKSFFNRFIRGFSSISRGFGN
jgi:hypothetical protein